MSQKTISAIQGIVVAVISALVTFGVLGGDQASAIQAVIVSGITLAAALGIHSVRPPVDQPTETVDPSTDTETPSDNSGYSSEGV
jgi:hypothetical protein